MKNYRYRKIVEDYNNGFEELELEYDYRLTKTTEYIMRLDGCHMTKKYKEEPKFSKVMKKSLNMFCHRLKNVKFGYNFSDEISILFTSGEDENKDSCRVEKILSTYASLLSSIFYQKANEEKMFLQDIPQFDARIIRAINKTNYFIYRQRFCIYQKLEKLKNEYEITQKETKEIIKELIALGIDYNKIYTNSELYGNIYTNNGYNKIFYFEGNEQKLSDLLK